MIRSLRTIALSKGVAFAGAFSLTLVLSASQVVFAQQAAGRLKGIVVDWQYALVLNSTIVFESESLKREVRVDQVGAYEIELPAGTYLVRAAGPGTLQRRLNFEVESNATRTLNVMLEVAPMKAIKCPKGRLCL